MKWVYRDFHSGLGKERFVFFSFFKKKVLITRRKYSAGSVCKYIWTLNTFECFSWNLNMKLENVRGMKYEREMKCNSLKAPSSQNMITTSSVKNLTVKITMMMFQDFPLTLPAHPVWGKTKTTHTLSFCAFILFLIQNFQVIQQSLLICSFSAKSLLKKWTYFHWK